MPGLLEPSIDVIADIVLTRRRNLSFDALALAPERRIGIQTFQLFRERG
jgi:hypothetical protein